MRATAHYAAPAGRIDGTGTADRPWDLATALRGGRGQVLPGDTVWLRGGTYSGTWTSTLHGTPNAPIVVRQYPGERATLDGRVERRGNDIFVVQGAWTLYWGFELTSSDPGRVSPDRSSNFRPDLLVNNGPHNKYINLIIHDGGVAFYTYSDAPGAEVYGCIIYNNGWRGPDRGHGHGLYLKSDEGPLVARDNILFNQFGYGVHAYTDAGTGRLRNIRLEGNIAFNNGVMSGDGDADGANLLVGGNQPASGITVVGNLTYFSPGVRGPNVVLGFRDIQNADIVAKGNYAAGGRPVLTVRRWSAPQVADNTLIDDAAAQHLTTAAVFVKPNAYEAGRAYVVVYNWGRTAGVPADLGAVLRVGDRYQIRSVQALFGPPVKTGTYAGGGIELPMSPPPPPTPVGMASSQAPPTGPAFEVFVISRSDR
jgi:hypothetical protein